MGTRHLWGRVRGDLKAAVVAIVIMLAISGMVGAYASAATSLFSKESKAADTGSTTSVKEGGLVNNVIRYNNNDTGIISDLTLDDGATNQTVVGTPKGITGWDLTSQAATGFQFKAALVPPGGKGLVFNTSQLAGTISGATGGGDGFVPLFADNGNVYWVFHHTAGRVQCANPATGTICPGYPKNLTYSITNGVTTENRQIWSSTSNHQHSIVGNRLYSAGALYNGLTTGVYQWGIGCFDLTTGAECADNPFQIAGTFPATLYSSNYSVVNMTEKLIGNNLYITDYSQKVHCYNVTSTPMSVCAGYPKDISNLTSFPPRLFLEQDTMVQEGARLFRLEKYTNVTQNLSGSGIYIKCFDTVTSSECAGWGTDGKRLAGTSADLGVFSGFVRFNTALQPDAICTLAYASTIVGCLNWADGSVIPDTASDVNGIPNTLYSRVRYTGNAGSVGNPGHRPGDHRTYFTAYGANAEYCWDWATNDGCKVATQNATNDLNQNDTAPGDGYFGDNGYLRHPANSNSRDYGARYQASSGCWWSIGDANLLWSFDDDGNVPCIPQNVRDKTTLDIASAYCSSGLPSDAAWTLSKVTNFNTADWTKFIVEIKDPDGNILLSYNAKTSTTFNISSINAQTHPEISYFVYAVVAPGRTPFANASTTPLVSVEFSSSSPIEFCAQTVAPVFVCNGQSNTIANLAELRIGAQTAPVATSNTSMAVTPDPAGKCADMMLTQHAVDPSSGNPISTYTPGTNVNWVLQPTNVSDYTATNVEVSMTFPPGVTPTIATGTGWTCAITGQHVSCTRPNQEPGIAPPLTIQTHIASNVTGPIANTATVGSDADDPTPANNIATTELTPDAYADLTIAKRHDLSPVAGGTFTYSFDVTNNGPSDTPSFTVTDTLEDSLTFVPVGSSPECSAVGQVVTCNGGALVSNTMVTLHFMVTVSPSHTSGPIPNSATVSGPLSDPQPDNNTSTDNVDPSAVADVAIHKSLEGSIIAGQNVTYTIAVTNHGPSNADNVTVTDHLPVGLTLISIASPDWQCVQTGSSVSCLLGSSLAPGQQSEGQLLVHVDSSVASAIQNRADVTSTATDPNLANNFSVAAAEIETQADVSITKQLVSSELRAGSNATYRLTAVNVGPSDASNVVVTDTLPTALHYVGFTADGWACSASGQTVTCSIPQLTLNDSKAIDIEVSVAIGCQRAGR